MKNLIQKVKTFSFEVFGKNAEIIAIVPVERGWQVTVEILMDEEYTVKRGRNDLLYVFEIIVDESLNILSYERIRIRERGKLED